MLRLKMKKMPKKPKSNATVKELERWIERATAVRKENAKRAGENKRIEMLNKKIAGFCK